MFFKKRLKKDWPYWTSFLLPLLIMTSYFAYRQMSPFGSQSILTVDLGQQYIDFFAYFKHALLNDPHSFLYSFSKAFGGEMVGVWAYYLMSPLNLLLLFFNSKSLPAGILIILVIKYGLAGLSFSYLIKKSIKLNNWLVIALSTAYALNGWIIANQLNVIWLDCMSLLPLIVLGVNRIVQTNHVKTYMWALTAMLIINYYMAYMICIFTVIYFFSVLINQWESWLKAIKKTLRWLIASAFSGGLAAFILLPTWESLKNSKDVYTVTKFKWKFEYPPFNFLAKFFNGSFNFNQMPNGTPNVFVGSIVLIAFLLFLINPKIKLIKRLTTVIVTIILILSMMIQPLDLFWHAMQFPIWYPYRFSFIFCFWLIWIAANQLSKSSKKISWIRRLTVLVIISIAAISVILRRSQFNFLTTPNVILGSIILIAALFLLIFFKKLSPYVISSICILTIGEMGLNVFNSLNNISYVTNTNYVNYTQNLKRSVKNVNQNDNNFFRLGKTFYRTKDDPFEADYNGGEHFSSTFEAATPKFMDAIGEPDGDGFIEYANGTILTDSLLNFKYFLHQVNPRPNQYLQSLTTKPDLKYYQLIRNDDNIETYKNPYRLPIAFAGSKNAFHSVYSTDPLRYQSNLFNQIAGNNINNNLFKAENFSSSSFINTQSQSTITGGMFKKNNLLKPAHIILNFTPNTNNSYYLTIGSNINNKNTLIKINNVPLSQYNVYRNTVTANIASKMKNKNIKIDIELLKGSIWLQNLTLYQMKNPQFEAIDHKLQNNPLNISHHNSNSFEGNININKQHSALITTIPYEQGWNVIANGKKVTPKKWANMFMGIKLHPGHYKIKIYYWPPLLTTGLIITGLSILIIIGTSIIENQKK